VNPSTAAAQVIIDELVRSGVNDVVLAPGSRSAALAIEAARAHARAELRLHVRIDERSAGFLALGLAKGGVAPVPVITTSGTAVANLRPAVEEAWYSAQPLVVITADRPAELRRTGANQTIDQVRAFDGVVRFAADIEAPTRGRGRVAYWRSTVARACSVASHPWQRGPVHLNVGFREPLVPGDEAGGWVEPMGGHDGVPFIDEEGDTVEVVRTWTVDRRLMLSVQEPIDELLDDIAAGPLSARGLVVVGDIDDPEDSAAAVELAESCGWPLLSEPTGGARAGSVAVAHAGLLAGDPAFRKAHRPDVVVTVGKVGLSRGVLALISESGLHVHAEPQRTLDWPDPTRTATAVLASVPAPPAEGDVPETSEWLDAWLMADAAAQRRVEQALQAHPTPTGLHAAAALWAAAGPDDLLFVASSRSIRDLDAVAAVRPDAPRVIANRGVNGIDGLVSTAIGAALAHQSAGGGYAYAMLGDLALLHDQNGLVLGPQEPVPDLCLVVVDNDGGGIFGSLEQAAPAFSDVYERVFGTPVGVSIPTVLTGLGVAVLSGDDLRETIELAADTPGISAVVVGPVDRAVEAELHRVIRGAAR
jgi:2-succinyl-5-enolpyruvyl-6-hydroxy-3-cyclohexene-1-carboxylate synthase